MFNVDTREIYIGLLDRVIQFCKDHDYTYEFVNNKFYGLPFEINENISKEGVKDYLNSICSHIPRDYQIEGVYDALKYNRKLLISPTASGKSLMIYGIVRYYVEKEQNILVVVPTTSLVEQMYKDFADYGWDVGSYCHKIYAGKERETDFKNWEVNHRTNVHFEMKISQTEKRNQIPKTSKRCKYVGIKNKEDLC